MDEEQRKARDPGDAIRDGVRAMFGVLGAFKEAVEQTFDELKQQGELSPERAKRAAQETMRRAQETVSEVRDRLEFVPRREFDALREEVAVLRAQVDALRAAPVQRQPASDVGESGQTGSGSTAAGDETGADRFPIDEG